MPSNGEQQPSGPPEYKVYRSRKGLLSRLRKPDLSSLRERAKRGRKRPRENEPERPRPVTEQDSLGRRVLKWVGDRGRRLDAAQRARLSGLRGAAVVEARRQRHRGAGRQPAADRRQPERSSSSAPTRGPPTARSPAPRPARMPRPAGASGEPPQRRLRRAVPGRHADARAGRRRRVPQALDPPRHLRRDPGRRPAEDQRRLRLRRRGAADRDRGGVPRHRHRPRRDHRLRGLRGPDRRDRRGRGRRPERSSAPTSPAAPAAARAGSRCASARASTPSTARRRSTYARIRKPSDCPGPARAPSPRLRRPRPRQGPAGGPQRDQGPAHRAPCGSPTTSSRGRSSAGTAPKAFVSDMGCFTMPQLVLSSAVGFGGEHRRPLRGPTLGLRRRPGRQHRGARVRAPPGGQAS